MDYFLPSDIARLVLGYLKENGYQKTYMCFLKECSDLQEYYKVLMAGRELQTTIMGFSLLLILEEWAKLKKDNSLGDAGKKDISDSRRKSPRRKDIPQSPLKQALSSSPLWTPNQARSCERLNGSQQVSGQTNSEEKEKGYPVLKGLLDHLCKENSTVSILPLSPGKQSRTPVQICSPLKNTSKTSSVVCDIAKTSQVQDSNQNSSVRNIADKGPVKSNNVGSSDNHVIGLPNSLLPGLTSSTNIESSIVPDLQRLNHVTPSKPTGLSTGASVVLHVTPVKLFQSNADTADANSTSTKSPRRKKPKTPRKRTSDVAGSNSLSSLSGAEDVPEPVFKKLLEDNRLHEKLAETCNTYLESITQNQSGKEKDNPASTQDHPEEVDPVTHSKSLEELLDLDTNFVADLVSDNIDMSDPAYGSLFRLFGKEKEVFCEELRRERKKTDDMAKEVEELENSIRQETEKLASQYNSPIHDYDQINAELAGTEAVEGHPLNTSMSSQPDSPSVNSQQANCAHANHGGFLTSWRNNELGSPLHSSSGQRNAISNVSSPSSVVTQPFSPTEYSQILSPSTPYHQPFTPKPSDSTLLEHDAINQSCSGGIMSPQPNGRIVVGHAQIHQSTPVRPKQGALESSIPNCSPLVKADLNANSPVMVQRVDPFTPKSTYTPQSRKSIFTPAGTNRLLFSPPAQIVPGSPIEQNGLVELNQPSSAFPQSTNIQQCPTALANMSVHEQGFGDNNDTNASEIENTSLVQSVFPLNTSLNPCSTIANSIGCISLPPQEQEKTTSTKRMGRMAKAEGKRKTKSKKGIEQGSSTFATLKNLLSQPAQPQMDPSSHLSMPDLLMPQGSPEVAHLSGEDIQNQNIVVYSPGGSSYKIPVLDCQDELGIQTEGAETISLWEATLNTSTQISILPENQVTQSLVNSIEQGNSEEILNKVQKNKTVEKSKKESERKQRKPTKKAKKKKKSKKSSYFQSPAKENEEVDEIYIASPLIWGEKTFIRNLDFGVSSGPETKFRKILPKPTSNTVIVVNNPEPVDSAHVCDAIPADKPGNVSDEISSNCDRVENETESPGNDTEMKSDTMNTQLGESECDKGNRGKDIEKLLSSTSGDSPAIESYKDWKGNMKAKSGRRNEVQNGKHISTSTPMHAQDTDTNLELCKRTTDPKLSVTPKTCHKSKAKQSQVIQADIKKSSCEKKTDLKAGFERIVTKPSSPLPKLNEGDVRRSPRNKLHKSVTDSISNKATVSSPKNSDTKRLSLKKNEESKITKSPPKQKGKAKKNKSNLLKVKLPLNKSRSTHGKDVKQVNSKRGRILIETDSDSSEEDIPLSELKKKSESLVDGASPAHSILSTPQKGGRSPSIDFASPSKEMLLEKVGLTPTKTVALHAFKSPGRANPLDVLAEWQGTPPRKKRHSGPITRNKLSKMRNGIKSPVKSPSSSNRRTSSRNSSNRNSCDKDKKASEKKQSKRDQSKRDQSCSSPTTKASVQGTPAKKLFGSVSTKSPVASGKKTPAKKVSSSMSKKSPILSGKKTPAKNLFTSVFGIQDKLEEGMISNNLQECVETVDISKEHAQAINEDDHGAQTNIVLEDELKQALLSIEMDSSALPFNNVDNIDEGGLISLETLERSNGVRHNIQGELSAEETTTTAFEDIQDKTACQNVKKVLSNESAVAEHVDSLSCSLEIGKERTTVIETVDILYCNDRGIEERIDPISNCLTKDIERTEVTESGDSLNNMKSGKTTFSNHKHDINVDYGGDRENQAGVSDTGIELSSYDTSIKVLSERARRKEKKRKHKEKKRLKKSLESGTPLVADPSTSDTGDKLTDSSDVHHRSHHHSHHHHRHHHHHGKHKKKKSRKRERDDMDGSKERHKSKRQRLEASRALEVVDIDEALKQLYSSPVAAI